MHPLDGARLKLVRAQEHADALKRELVAFSERDPYEIVAESDTERGEYILKAVVREQLNPYWGAVVGDLIHNARSALNYLACELVTANGGTVTVRTQFPIFETERAFQKRSGPMIEGMHPDPAAVIKELQPYHRQEPQIHPLAVIGTLSNRDKHRAIPISIFFPQRLEQTFRFTEGDGRVDVLHFHSGPIEDGTEIARVRIIPITPSLSVDVDTQTTTLILIGNLVKPGSLDFIIRFVREYVIPRFERFV